MKETRIHYAVKSPINIYLIGRLKFPNSYKGNLHYHNFYELIIGKYENKQDYFQEVILPLSEHSFKAELEGEIIYVLFSGIEGQISELSQELCQKIFNSNDEKSLYNSIAEGLNYVNKCPLICSDFAMQGALAYIEQNITQKLTVEEIAKSLYITPKHFGQCFKKQMGKNVLQYINELRMQKALPLLISGNSVSKTAHLVGYDDIYYFSKQFKRIYGVNPSSIHNGKIYK